MNFVYLIIIILRFIPGVRTVIVQRDEPITNKCFKSPTPNENSIVMQ